MKKKNKMTLEEIVQGWGSLEAYLEEQRRTGICELEAKSFEFPAKNSSQPALFDRISFNQSESNQLPVSPDFNFTNPVEPELLPTNYLAFIRWLYLSGRLES
jgi:hypothetical protein